MKPLETSELSDVSAIVGRPRPSRALQSVLAFINALPVALGVADLAQNANLSEVQAAVHAFRARAMAARADSLRAAVFSGDENTVLQLLEKRVDCNAKDSVRAEGALHAAVAAHRYELVELLLDARADPALQNSGGDTPLLLASSDIPGLFDPERRIKAIRMMLENCDPERSRVAAQAANSSGATPLLRLVEQLVRSSNSVFSNNGVTFTAELDLARLLVEKGADPEAANFFGFTPASEAQKSLNPSVRELFLR